MEAMASLPSLQHITVALLLCELLVLTQTPRCCAPGQWVLLSNSAELQVGLSSWSGCGDIFKKCCGLGVI